MLKFARQLLHTGVNWRLFLFGLRQTLFEPLRQTFLITLLLTGGVAFTQTGLVALFMSLNL